MGFNSKYTGAEVEKRLDQNYYDDVLKAGVDSQIIPEQQAEVLDKIKFDNKLAFTMFRDVASRKQIEPWSTQKNPYADETNNISDIMVYLTDEVIMNVLYLLEDYHYTVLVNQNGHYNYYYIDVSKAGLSNNEVNRYFKIYKPINFDSTDRSILDQDIVELWIAVGKATEDASPVIKKEVRVIPAKSYSMTQGRVYLGKKDIVGGNEADPYNNIKAVSDSYTDEELKALIDSLEKSPADAFIIDYAGNNCTKRFYIDKHYSVLSGFRLSGIKIYNPMEYGGDGSFSQKMYELFVLKKTYAGSSSIDILRSIRFIPLDLNAGERYDISLELVQSTIELNIEEFYAKSLYEKIVAIKKLFLGKRLFFIANLVDGGINLAKFNIIDAGDKYCYFVDFARNSISDTVHHYQFKIYYPNNPLLVIEGFTDSNGSISHIASMDLSSRRLIESKIHGRLGIGLDTEIASGSSIDTLMLFEKIIGDRDLKIDLADILNHIKSIESPSNTYYMEITNDVGSIVLYADYAPRSIPGSDISTLTIYNPEFGPEAIAMVVNVHHDSSTGPIVPDSIDVKLINYPYSTGVHESISGEVSIDLSNLPSYKEYDVANGTEISLTTNYPGYNKETIIQFISRSGDTSFTIPLLRNGSFHVAAGQSILIRFTWVDGATILFERIYGDIIKTTV